MSPFRYLAMGSVGLAVALLSYALIAAPPLYREVVLLLQVTGQAMPLWPEGLTDAATVRAMTEAGGGLDGALWSVAEGGTHAPLWTALAWALDGLPGGLQPLRALSALALGLAVAALWPMFRRIAHHQRDQLFLMGVLLLLPGAQLAGAAAGPEALAILGVAMALSAASAGIRRRRLSPGRALMLGAGSGIAAASALVALPAALVLLLAGLLRLDPGERMRAWAIALSASLPLITVALAAVLAPSQAAQAPLALTLADDPVGTYSFAEVLGASAPGRARPPAEMRLLLAALAAAAVIAGLNGLLRGRERAEFAAAGLAAAASLGFYLALPGLHAAPVVLVALTPLVAIVLGAGALSPQTKIIAAPLILAHGLTGAITAATERGEAQWRVADKIAAMRDLADVVVIDRAPGAPPDALPYQIALGLPGEQPMIVADAEAALSGGARALDGFDVAHVVHAPGGVESGRIAALRTKLPGERQRVLERGTLYELIQLGIDQGRDPPEEAPPKENGSDQ
ncbi:MAG: hypothetical protein AAGE80_10430 [Pseudomonadota bacterium]